MPYDELLASLTMLIHGESGVGKSWLAETAPGPRLFLDVEGRAVHLRRPKIVWDPLTQPLPMNFADGSPVHTDTTIVVNVRDFTQFETGYQVLASGEHYFKSAIIDSGTEIQQRCLDLIAGVDKVTTPEWGDLLRKMEKLVRDFRDLRTHPTNPLQCLVVVCGSHEKSGRIRPLLQGGLSNKLAYHFDTVGYLNFEYDQSTQQTQRVLAIQPYGLFVAKDNTHTLSQHYGLNIINPNISEMIAVLNGAA